MMTRRTLNVGPRTSFARLLRNHIRLLGTACVTSLLAAVIFLVPSTEGAAPVFAGEPVNLVVTGNTNTSITLGWTAPAGNPPSPGTRSEALQGQVRQLPRRPR